MKKRFNKDALISQTGEIADAFSVFIAAGGNVAVWVLFICMIANIIDAAVNFPTVVSVAIMVIQAVVLDIAGFGLQTIAKRLLKVNDEEVQEAARKGKSFAGWLIGVMIVTMILITSKTLAPVVIPLFSKDSHLVETIQNNIDVIDKVLVLARIGFTVAYVHTIHNLREIDSDLQQEEEQQVQANDQLALGNQKKLDTLASENRDLRSLVDQLITRLDAQEQRHLQAIEEANKEVHQMVMQQLTQVTINLVDDRLNEVVSASTGGHLPLQLDSPAQKSARYVESRDTDETPAVSTLDTQVSTQIEEVNTLDSDDSMQAKIYALLAQEPRLSARAIATRVNCSPTTANKWKAQFLAELQAVGSR